MVMSSSSGNCKASHTILSFYNVVTSKNTSAFFSYFFNASCQGSEGLDSNRAFLIFGLADLTWGEEGSETNKNGATTAPIGVELNKSTSIICNPGYLLQNVDVVRNGTAEPSVSLSRDPTPRTLDNVHPWAIMKANVDFMVDETVTSYGNTLLTIADAEVLTDSFTKYADVLPRSPTSIANVVSLAAGGNLFEFLAENGEGGLRSPSFVDNHRFWLGWRRISGPNTSREEQLEARFKCSVSGF